jgi:hypothetical protein
MQVTDEVTLWPSVCETWAMRCRELSLKKGTQVRERELTAYLQGVLAVATAAQIVTHERASMIGFLFTVGRGEDLLAPKAAA